MSTPSPRRGLHPAFAALALSLGLGVAGRSIFVALRPPSAGAADVAANVDDVSTPDAESSSSAAQEWQDLLALHGSWDRTGDVQLVFASADQMTPARPAPAGEVAVVSRDGWRGEPPPALRLGVVMLSGASRRAVLDGRIVGVGDRILDGEVTVIEAGMVVIRRGDRSLTYDFADTWPREFRAEAARRAAASSGKQEIQR